MEILKRKIKNCDFIDIHRHPSMNLEKSSCIKELKESKILLFNASTWETTQRESIISCPGIHPWESHTYMNQELSQFNPLFQKAPLIGEIGLDKLWAPKEADIESQRQIFSDQLRIAETFKKPITLHTKDAEEEIYQTIQGYNIPSILIHWYSGSLETFYLWRGLDVYFSLSPAILCDPYQQMLLGKIPLNRLLFETDNPTTWPWLFPEEEEDMNQIKKVYQKASELKNIPLSSLIQICKRNCLNFLFDNSL